MGEVDEDAHRVVGNPLQSSGNLWSAGEAQGDVLQFEAGHPGDPGCCQGVLHIEAAKEWEMNGGRFLTVAKIESRAFGK
jgi:hypothetical protein